MKLANEQQWERKTISELGISLDFFAGTPFSEGTFEGTTYVIQKKDPVVLGIWYGPKETLNTFRAGFGPSEVVTFGSEESLSVCNVKAKRQIATVAEGTATGLVREADGSLGHIYAEQIATTHIALAFRINEYGVLIRWQVPTSDRENNRKAEEHFFASLSCD